VNDDEEHLLAAIAADPEDPQAREVYADWLDNRDDLRGEYLRLEALFHAIPAKLVTLAAGFDPAWLTRVGRQCDVRLTKAGPNKIAAIKLVRELSGLGLKDAFDLVGATTSPVVVGAVDHDAALKIRERFEQIGCEVAVVGVGTTTARLVSIPTPALPVARGVNVMLEAITDRRGAISVVRDVRGCGIREAFRIVERVAAGTPVQIAAGIQTTRATEILAAFAPVGRATCTSATPGV
jgi:large subunit ribosomal protein L7/L12